MLISTWRGQTAAALRLAMRRSCDDFAAHLGVSARGVAKWEAHPASELALRTQEVLDAALKRAGDDVQGRFALLLEEGAPTFAVVRPGTVAHDLAASGTAGGNPTRATPE